MYQSADLAQVRKLDGQVQPCLAEDQADVDEMNHSMQLAEQNRKDWGPIPPGRSFLDRPKLGYLAFWVAVLENKGEKIIGMVGVGQLYFEMLPLKMPYVQDLSQRRISSSFNIYAFLWKPAAMGLEPNCARL